MSKFFDTYKITSCWGPIVPKTRGIVYHFLCRFPSIGKHSSPFLRNRLQKCYCRWSV